MSTQATQEHARRDDVEGAHAGRADQRPVLGLEEVPDRAPVRRAGIAELIEAGPSSRGHDHHRQVHHEPRDRRGAERDPELPHPACAQAEQQQWPEEQQRIELGRHGQAEEHAGQHPAPGRPGRHARHGQAHRDQVPVDVRGQDDRGGQRHAQRGPAAGPAREVGGGQHTDDREHGEQDHGQVEELPAPGERVGDGPDQPRHQLHGPADEHRVLDRVVSVGHLARRQSLTEIQRVDVGITVRLELGEIAVPRARPAGPLAGQRQRGAEQRGRDQRRDRSRQQRSPARPGMRPSLRPASASCPACGCWPAGPVSPSVTHAPSSAIGSR